MTGYPREIFETDPEAVPKWGRWAGCGCLFLPAGLFLLAMTGGLILGERSLPDGSIGWEPGRPLRILATVALAGVYAVVGALWVAGRPRRTLGAGRLIGGALLTLIGAQQGLLKWNLPIGLAFSLPGIALIAWAYLGDRGDGEGRKG